jgi:glutathione S-transferase
MKINPSGGLPVAIIKGRTMAESNDIMMTIEKEFPTFNPLLPAKDSKEFQRVAPLMKLEVICIQ